MKRIATVMTRHWLKRLHEKVHRLRQRGELKGDHAGRYATEKARLSRQREKLRRRCYDEEFQDYTETHRYSY